MPSYQIPLPPAPGRKPEPVCTPAADQTSGLSHVSYPAAAVIYHASILFAAKFPDLPFVHLPSVARDCTSLARPKIQPSVGVQTVRAAVRALYVALVGLVAPLMGGEGTTSGQIVLWVDMARETAMAGLHLPDVVLVQTLAVLAMREWGLGRAHEAWMYSDHAHLLAVEGFDIWYDVLRWVVSGGRRRFPHESPWELDAAWMKLRERLRLWRRRHGRRLCFPETSVETVLWLGLTVTAIVAGSIPLLCCGLMNSICWNMRLFSCDYDLRDMLPAHEFESQSQYSGTGPRTRCCVPRRVLPHLASGNGWWTTIHQLKELYQRASRDGHAFQGGKPRNDYLRFESSIHDPTGMPPEQHSHSPNIARMDRDDTSMSTVAHGKPATPENNQNQQPPATSDSVRPEANPDASAEADPEANPTDIVGNNQAAVSTAQTAGFASD
ncbi:hypothetical protein Cpir12675_000407 [Ceratocystis pirilliformis]|uniref:Uncharacterized protein n=1 Tax=Ceratocystis pirilliformis TaxID=259994 RepID=A0ABR3ZLE7_9PEZI